MKLSIKNLKLHFIFFASIILIMGLNTKTRSEEAKCDISELQQNKDYFYNFTKGEIIEAIGIGTADEKTCKSEAHCFLMAEKSSMLSALRNLAVAAGGQYLIHSNNVLGRADTYVSGDMCARLTTFIKGASTNCTKVKNDKGYVVTRAVIKLDGEGGIIKPIYDDMIKIEEKSKIQRYVPVKKPSIKDKYTGLILNATELQANPSLSPKILSNNSKEIFGLTRVKKQIVLNNGVAQFTDDLKSARDKTDLIGKNPLIIKALKSGGYNNTIFYISDEDADLIESVNKDEKFLENGKVIIVL